jgi:hypothetical protein
MKKKNIAIILIILFIVGFIIGFFASQEIKKDNREYEIEQITEYNYFVVKENNKYGVIDKNANKIVENNYDNIVIPNPNKPVFICYEGDSTKVLNDKSEEIFTEYENVTALKLKNVSGDLIYEKSILKYEKDGKYGIIDFQGKRITKAIYEDIDTLQFKEGELLVKKDEKYGVINIKGNQLVPNNYDQIEVDKYYKEDTGYKEDGYIVINTTEEGYRYGYIDVNGKEILKPVYNDLSRILEIDSEEPYIICAKNGKYGVMKNNQQIIENDYQSIRYDESNNILIALKGKKYGVISIEGNTIIPFEYKQIDITGEYIYATTSDENIKVFDAKGNETDLKEDTSIINIENTEYKIYIQTLDGKTTYKIYKNQKSITQDEYAYIQYLYDNYFIVCNSNGKLGIIDDSENIKVDYNYSSIQKIENANMIQAINNVNKMTEIYSKDMQKICELENATIENAGEYIKLYNDSEIKYISKEGKELKDTELFSDHKIFPKKQNGLWGFVDKNGNTIVEFEYENVTEVNDYGYAGIKKDGKWGVVDSEGKIILEPTYELKNTNQPIFIGKYYQVVYGNGEIYYTK